MKDRALKITRRIRVSIKWLGGYSIQRGDTAIVAMTGDVQIGELGYVDVTHQSGNYNQFAFVCEQDSTCFNGYYGYERESDSVCLRDNIKKCAGRHHATPYGRVVAVERKRQAVETLLTFRPLDEREQATTSIPRRSKTEVDWPDTIGIDNEPEPQSTSESPLNAIGDSNIVDLGETANVGGKTIPVLHVKKWLREVHPQTVRILCCGPPGDPLWYGRDKTHALYAAICGDKVRELSLEHGGMVCERHATPEYCVDLEGTGGHWASDGNGTLALVMTSQTERANLILDRIEEAARKYWRKNKPDPNFANWFNEIWTGLATSLTSQVRYSCEPALYGKDSSMSN